MFSLPASSLLIFWGTVKIDCLTSKILNVMKNFRNKVIKESLKVLLAVVELPKQYIYIGIGVGAILLEIVVLLHGLIIEVLAVHYKDDLVYLVHA